MVPKAAKRKLEDDLSLPHTAIKKAKASLAEDRNHGDDNEPQSSRSRWLEDTLRLSSDKISEPSKENPVGEVEKVSQGGNDTDEEDQAYLDSEDHFKKQSIKQSIAIPDGLDHIWESKQSSDLKLDIYPLNAAEQLQNDLENLESEMVIRDRIPWESFKQELCRGCKGIVNKHLQAINRRQPENSATDELDVQSRPSLGTRGGFDYFLGLPTLEELAKKHRDIETLRTLRPISQKFPLEDVEPKLCEKCDKNLRTSGKLPAKAGATAPGKLPAKAGATAPVTSHFKQIVISSGSEGVLVHVTAEKSKPKPNVEKQPVPASGTVTAKKDSTPEQLASDKAQPPAKAEMSKIKGPAHNADEPQPPIEVRRSKRQGPASKIVAPEKPQPVVRNEKPKRKRKASKAVASEGPQPPATGGKPKKKDPTPGPIAPKEAKPIQPAASKKTRKKASRAGKTNIPDAPPASPEPATHGVDKVEDGTNEEAGPIQRVMGNLPEKPKGHDYYCAISYTNLTRMGSAKKLEHLERCGTALEEVKVMTKAQAQAAKLAR